MGCRRAYHRYRRADPKIAQVIGKLIDRLDYWLYNRTRKQFVWTAVAVTALVFVAGALMLAVKLHADFGNVPGWISAFGTVGTGVGLILAWRSFRHSQRTRADDEAIPARLVRTSFTLLRPDRENPTGALRLVISTPQGNGHHQRHISLLLVYGAKFECLSFSPSMMHLKTGEGELATRELVDYSNPMTYIWKIPESPRWNFADVQRAEASIIFTDKNGRVWCLNTGNPHRPNRFY